MAERKTYGKLYIVQLRQSRTQPDDGEVHAPMLTLYFRGHPTYEEVKAAIELQVEETRRPSKKAALQNLVYAWSNHGREDSAKIPLSMRVPGTSEGTLTCGLSQTKVFWTAPPKIKK